MDARERGYRVRAARGDDFETITALLESLGREQVTDATNADARAVYGAQIVDPDAHHMVVEDAEGQVVAFCSLHFRRRLNHVTEEAWIPDLFVVEEARRQGIGRMLLEEAERRAEARGCWSMTLESGHQRAEAHQLYRSFRMRDMGRYFAKRLLPEGVEGRGREDREAPGGDPHGS